MLQNKNCIDLTPMKKAFFTLLLSPFFLFGEEGNTLFQQASISRPNPLREKVQVDFHQVFQSAPIIYTILILLSISAVMIAFYILFSSRESKILPKELSLALLDADKDQSIELCENAPSLLAKMALSGIKSKTEDHQEVLNAMEACGKRETANLWQKIALLGEIAAIAPMIGLLGTVIGMFYGFYDMDRSAEKMSALFDGIGISVGTTVAGLIVALVSMGFYTFLKFRMVRLLNHVEHEVAHYAGRLSVGPHS